MHEQLRHRLLGGWSRLVSHRPGWVLFVAGVLAVASVAVAAGQLRFQSNRNDLIDDDLWWNQLFIRWQAQFTGNSDFVVAVDTHAPDGEPSEAAARRARRLVDELGETLQRSDATSDVLWSYDTAAAHPRALRLESMPAFRAQLARIAQAQPLLESPTPQALVTQIVAEMRQAGSGDEAMKPAEAVLAIESVADLIGVFATRLRTPAGEPVDLMALAGGEDAAAARQYLQTENGRFLIIRVTPARQPGALNPLGASIVEIRRILDETRADYPDTAFGLTGIEVVEADETNAATADSTLASIIAVVLIAALLVTAFHSVRTPLMLMAALGVGVAWSFGFLTLTIGHLQVISVVFTVILLGLGVAFGIHLASRFELIRHDYPDTEAGFSAALQDTLETVGPGLLTGALTTAAAFCTTLLTDFQGVAEMGAIAAAGILLCLIAMGSVFPALLRLFKAGHKDVVRMERRRVHVFEERWVMPFVRHPRRTLIAAGVLFAVSLAAITQMRFDYNLLELLPTGVNSVVWQQRIVEQGEQSIWSATSIADSLAEAREKAEAFRELPTVESVAGIGVLFPPDEPAKLAMLEALREALGDEVQRVLAAPATQPAVEAAPSLVDQLAALRFLLPLALQQAPPELQAPLRNVQASLETFSQAAATLTPEQRAARLAALQRDYQRWREQVAQQIAGVLAPGPVQVSDLPPRLLSSYVARTDAGTKYALEVYPRLPPDVEDPLQPGFLGRFVANLRTVDPNVTGVVVQIYESGELIWTSYVKAAGYALVAVFVLVWIDFRSIRDALLSLAPVAAGFAVTLAVMWLVGEDINPANIIVLPLMFGIGVDAGVHILHRYRNDPHTRPLGLTAGTGKGITLTSFTTMIGFGSMLIAHHRGIASLGFVLAVGIGLTLLACWTIMPAWLELRSRRIHRR